MRNTRNQRPRNTPNTNRENVYGGFAYRNAYFDKYRGIFGYLYICSQCLRTMVCKTEVKVDHMLPPSLFARKVRRWGRDTGQRKASLVSRCLNSTFNCVAICGPCNSSKGNRVDHRLLKAIAAKLVEVALNAFQMCVVSALFVSLNTIRLPFIGCGWLLFGRRRSRSRNRRGLFWWRRGR